MPPAARRVDRLDGLSLDLGDWRMNLRASNTEPLLRLNIETRADMALLDRKVDEIDALLEPRSL
jgi:phosphomannomutase